MRVLVCGSRHFTDQQLLYSVLDDLHKKHLIDLIIEGDARGADRIAGQWAKRNLVDLRIFPADWSTHGKRAGPIRNNQMLVEGRPELVVAFLAPDSRGTANMIAQAERAGVKTIVVNI